MKKIYLLAITIVVAGLMITSATSMATNNKSTEKIAEPTAEFLAMPCQLVNTVKIDNSASGATSLFAGSQITGGDYNEYHPSFAADTSGVFFAAYDGTQDGTIYYPTFTASTDGGQTWGDGAYFAESAGASKPNVDYKPAKGFYATFDPSFDNSGQVWIVDATDLSNVLGAFWPWGDQNFDSFESLHLATYTHAGPTDDGAWNWGGIALTGFNGYSSPNIAGCPFVTYQYDVTGYALIGWLTNSDGCTHASNAIDQMTNMSYSAYDRNVSGKYQLLIRKDNFGVWNYNSQYDYWSHPYVTAKTITATGSLMYPDIIADQNKVIVVAQYDNAGNQDIVCYYSSNGMGSNTKSIVADSAENELYPQISWMKPGVAVCTYIKGDQAFFKTTEDGGATWSTEARVSDEQISPVENKALSISGINGNAYAVWQDGRGANIDIYWDKFYQVAAPNIQIGTVAGGVGKVTMDVLNTGDGAATNVTWSIIVKGGILKKIDVTTTGTIPNLAASGTETVKTDKFIFGLGKITIGLTAGQATASKTGKVFLFFVTGVK